VFRIRIGPSADTDPDPAVDHNTVSGLGSRLRRTVKFYLVLFLNLNRFYLVTVSIKKKFKPSLLVLNVLTKVYKFFDS
jgi:hypothetical protein